MDLKELKALLRLMEGNDVEELEVEEGGRRIRIRRRSAQALIPQAAMLPVPQATVQAAGAPAQDTAGLIPVESPMVGTFYRAPAPGAPAFVEVGSRVAAADTVCILEIMKLMNSIAAGVRGRVARICVENATLVEYGQPLVLIEPEGPPGA